MREILRLVRYSLVGIYNYVVPLDFRLLGHSPVGTLYKVQVSIYINFD